MSRDVITFDAAARERLAKLLGLLSSDHDGEIATAGRMANRLVKSCGMTWVDVIATPALPPPPSAKAKRSPDWPELAQAVLDSGAASAWETSFCENLLARWRGRPLSEKQAATLQTIWAERCGVDQ
jgi:hypothetical protein